MDELPLLAGFRVVPYYALTRFGRWDEMLSEPGPAGQHVYLKGIWHYARGIAFVGQGRSSTTPRRSWPRCRRIAADPALDFTLFSPNTAAAIFAIAPEVLAGELGGERKEYDTAIAHLERAVRLEDGLVYTEPAEWHYPPRAGAGRGAARGRPAARGRDRLLGRPEAQPRATAGRSSAWRRRCAAQGRKDEAAAAEARFQKAWAKADVKLHGLALLRTENGPCDLELSSFRPWASPRPGPRRPTRKPLRPRPCPPAGMS